MSPQERNNYLFQSTLVKNRKQIINKNHKSSNVTNQLERMTIKDTGNFTVLILSFAVFVHI